MDSSYLRTSLLDPLLVIVVVMLIAAPFAAPKTLVDESPVQEFMGFTGSHPFQESTGRSSSFSGSMAYATDTLAPLSSVSFKKMDTWSPAVRDQQIVDSSIIAPATVTLSSSSSDNFYKHGPLLSRNSRSADSHFYICNPCE